MLAVVVQLALGLCIALVTTGSRTRKRFGVALSLLSVVPPFLAPPDATLFRFIAALGTFTNIVRALDLYDDERTWSAPRRIWLMYSIFDARRAERAPREFDTRAWVAVVGFSLLSSAAAATIAHVPPVDASSFAVRWLAGALFVYTTFDAAVHLVLASYHLLGFEIPRLHNHPILSRTLNDFWGRRWNLVVHEVLGRYFFRPLVRRGYGKLGIFAAFGASALLHAWLTYVPMGAKWAGVMAAYFVIQGIGISLERPLGVARWPRALSHAWTIAWTLVPSPMFVEPMIQAILGSFAPPGILL